MEYLSAVIPHIVYLFDYSQMLSAEAAMIVTLGEIKTLSSTLFYNSLTCHTSKLLENVSYSCISSVFVESIGMVANIPKCVTFYYNSINDSNKILTKFFWEFRC